MATYHCSIKQGKVGNAKQHCDYIFREGRYASGEMKEELVYKGSGNLPSWAINANEFFEKADVFERKNGYAYTEFEVALPAEISLDENIKMLNQFIKKHIGDRKIYAVAIHEKMAALSPEKRQPHAHIMFSERVIFDKENVKPASQFFKRYNRNDKNLGGYLKDNRFTKNFKHGASEIEKIRLSWEKLINETYERKGLNLKVSSLSFTKRLAKALNEKDYFTQLEVNRLPQKHLGPRLTYQMTKGMKIANFHINLLSDKAQLVYISKEIQKVNDELIENKKYVQHVKLIKERQTHNLQELQSEVKNQELDILGSNLISKVYKACGEMGKIIQSNNAKISEVAKEILSEDRIIKMAESIYTKGATSKTKKELRRLEVQKEEWKKEFDAFSNLPLPKFYDVNYKSEYEEKHNRLMKWQDDIITNEQILKAKQDVLDKELIKPEHQEKISAIAKIIRDKNIQKKEFLENLKSENRECNRIGRQLLLLNKELGRKIKYSVKKDTLSALDSNNVKQLQVALAEIKNKTSKMRDAGIEKGNKMQVKLHDDSDDRSGNDIGI